MKKQLLNPPSLMPPRGFTHGIVVSGGRLLFLAGQDGSDAHGRIESPGDLVAQFERALRNLKVVVEAAGGTLRDIVKLNVYTTDLALYRSLRKEIGVVFRRYFEGYYPAMALFGVTGLFNEDALVEVEGIAVIPDPS